MPTSFEKTKFKFDSLIKEFIKSYNSKNGLNITDNFEIDKTRDGNEFRLTASLKNLPRRHGSRKSIIVFIDSKIRISDSDLIECYSTKIGYLEDKGSDNFVCIEGFHFDFRTSNEDVIQPGHPIFHMQLEKKAVHDYMDKKKLEYSCQDNYSIKTIRVPSSQMDFFSCVVMVIADHVYCDDLKNDFELLIKKVHELIPTVSLKSFNDKTKECMNSDLRSTSWYFASMA